MLINYNNYRRQSQYVSYVQNRINHDLIREIRGSIRVIRGLFNLEKATISVPTF